jgi:hypothetical protein
LAEHRGIRNLAALPPLTAEQILCWADHHRQHTGTWPTQYAGPVHSAPGESWGAINLSLTLGRRGLTPGLSLAQLLTKHRKVRNHLGLPRLRIVRILQWADTHRGRTGKWPHKLSGPIAEAPGETWMAVHIALNKGRRGLPGGSSLACLLAAERGARHKNDLPKLTKRQIMSWAVAHHARTGHWPDRNSGIIPDAPGETWSGVAYALWKGRRGLSIGSSLGQLLASANAARKSQ